MTSRDKVMILFQFVVNMSAFGLFPDVKFELPCTGFDIVVLRESSSNWNKVPWLSFSVRQGLTVLSKPYKETGLTQVLIGYLSRETANRSPPSLDVNDDGMTR